MALPLQVQLFNAFVGTQEAINSILLPDVFSPGGSQNVFMDKYGRVTKILGYTRNNDSAQVMHTTGNPARVTGLRAYQQDGGTNQSLIGIFDDGTAGWQIFTSTNLGSSWTFQFDAGAGSINQRADFAQLGTNLFITNGKMTPQKWNGTALSAVGNTRSPQPTLAAGAAGQLNGFYTYKLLSVVSTGAAEVGSLSSNQVSLNNQQGSLTWTADANTNVVGYQVYRTSGTGGIFYFVSYVSGRLTTAFTDNVPDSTLINAQAMPLHGDNPPTAYFVTSHNQRVWWLKTDTNPMRMFWSDVNVGDSVGPQSFLDLTDTSEGTGDAITGAVGGFSSGFMMIFTQNSVWRLSGTGQLVGGLFPDWTLSRTAAATGTVSANSVVRVPVGARYGDQTGQVQTTFASHLAYWTPLGDIRMNDGDNERIIGYPMKFTTAGFSQANASKIFAVHDASRKQFIWFFPSANAVECDTAVVWNYAWGAWYKWTPFTIDSACLGLDGQTVFLGEALTSKGGFTYTLFSGAGFDGTAFTSQWMTKALYGQDQEGKPMLSWRKRFRWADLLFSTNGACTMNLAWVDALDDDNAAAFNTVSLTPGGASITSVDGFTVLSGSGDVIDVTTSAAQSKVLLSTNGDYYTSEGIRLRVTDTSLNGQWSLDAFAIAYQALTGLKRREAD